MTQEVVPLLYRGSVKDIRGPVSLSAGEGAALVFDYSDAYSVFDWGRMPDLLPGKGAALAVMAAHSFEQLSSADRWRQFSKSAQAHRFRKSNRFGSACMEWGEHLQKEGLRTHYLGLWGHLGLRAQGAGSLGSSALGSSTLESSALEVWYRQALPPPRQLLVRAVSVLRPERVVLLGRDVPDYSGYQKAPAPKLVPLEVVFRFSCPPGSSLVSRLRADSSYLSTRGYPDITLEQVEAQATWDFPILELFTKLETTDRPLTLSEAFAIAGLSAKQFEQLLFLTAWVAAFLRWQLNEAGLELADGKLEWGLDATGALMLVDAIGPDELRVLKNGVQLSKEFLREHYRQTEWYQNLLRAKAEAQLRGVADWKQTVPPPPALPEEKKQLAVQLYLALAQAWTGKRWFADAWELDRVVEGLRSLGTPEQVPGQVEERE